MAPDTDSYCLRPAQPRQSCDRYARKVLSPLKVSREWQLEIPLSISEATTLATRRRHSGHATICAVPGPFRDQFYNSSAAIVCKQLKFFPLPGSTTRFQPSHLFRRNNIDPFTLYAVVDLDPGSIGKISDQQCHMAIQVEVQSLLDYLRSQDEGKISLSARDADEAEICIHLRDHDVAPCVEIIQVRKMSLSSLTHD